MKSLISCQNEASRGLSSASRLTALSSSSSAARCAARFVPTGVRKSRILSSAVSSLFACNSDDRARNRKASMHVSRRVLMTRLNDAYSSRIYYVCLEIFSHKNLRMLPSLHRLFRGLFRQYFLVCPFARRDRVFWIDTDIWPAAYVDTDPTSCAQRLAFTGKQKTRVVHDAL